jgi:2-polyprenyl-3-methyl-5-hydroxy-6-metoxy-1,4-benzoquinol methylase
LFAKIVIKQFSFFVIVLYHVIFNLKWRYRSITTCWTYIKPKLIYFKSTLNYYRKKRGRMFNSNSIDKISEKINTETNGTEYISSHTEYISSQHWTYFKSTLNIFQINIEYINSTLNKK